MIKLWLVTCAVVIASLTLERSRLVVAQPSFCDEINQCTVSSKEGWFKTGFVLDQDDIFEIEIVGGSWTVDRNNWPSVGPNGYQPEVDSRIGFDEICKTKIRLPYATLLGRIGEESSDVFVVGDGGTFVATTKGSLYLRINDNTECMEDNEGSIRVRLSRHGGDHLVLGSTKWLGGQGVGVFFRNRRSCDFNCSPVLQPYRTCAFQCVDLAVRLYGKVGYPQWSLSGSVIGSAVAMIDVALAREEDFDDLLFYPNDGTAARPPAPGNLLIFAADDSNGNYGHVAVVSEVYGDVLKLVQQNMCLDNKALWEDYALIEAVVRQGQQTFRVKPRVGYAGLLGWISSDRLKTQMIDQASIVQTGGISWNRDDTAVYVYLTPQQTRSLAFSEPSRGGGQGIISSILNDLEKGGALAFTSRANAAYVLMLAHEWIRKDPRLNPRQGVRSVDITIKYTGRIFWLRPHGGPAEGKWIPFVAGSMWQESRERIPHLNLVRDFRR